MFHCWFAVAKEQVSEATSTAEVAEARLKSTQEQLGKANDAAAAAQDKMFQLEVDLDVSDTRHHRRAAGSVGYTQC
jgi:hypothetical protein